MKKVIMFNLMTLDGFFEGANREFDWTNINDEFFAYATAQLNEVGTLLFGRVTYEHMASYWPTPAAIAGSPIIAHKMNTLPKVVISRTLNKADWENSTLIKSDAVQAVTELKQTSDKDIFIFGSANLSDTLRQHDLIDEYRIMLNPILLGKGNPLFKETDKRTTLTLIKTIPFNSGNILLIYEPKK